MTTLELLKYKYKVEYKANLYIAIQIRHLLGTVFIGKYLNKNYILQEGNYISFVKIGKGYYNSKNFLEKDI